MELGGPILKWGLRDGSPPAKSRGRAPGRGLGMNPQKLKKHCKLYTLEKFCASHDTRGAKTTTVRLPARGREGVTFLSSDLRQSHGCF